MSRDVPEEIPGRTLLKKNITPERALAEFTVACDVWIKYMDEAHKWKALAALEQKLGAIVPTAKQ